MKKKHSPLLAARGLAGTDGYVCSECRSAEYGAPAWSRCPALPISAPDVCSYRGTPEHPVFYHVGAGSRDRTGAHRVVGRLSALPMAPTNRASGGSRCTYAEERQVHSHYCCRVRTSIGEMALADQDLTIIQFGDNLCRPARWWSPRSAMRPICGPRSITRRKTSTSKMRWVSRFHWRWAGDRAAGATGFVVEGDGALRMHMGALATLGAVAPGNLTVLSFRTASTQPRGATLNQSDPRSRSTGPFGGRRSCN